LKKIISFFISFLLLFSFLGVEETNAESMKTESLTTPEKIEGNFPNIEGHLMFKIEGKSIKLGANSYIISDTNKTISITLYEDNTIDFQSEIPICHAFVKGGNGGYIYNFEPAANTYKGLHPLENKNGYKEISHVCFYYDDPNASKGQINIIKTINTSEGSPQENVEFTLTKEGSENESNSLTKLTRRTDENGSIFFDQLDSGTYKLVEAVPSGYLQLKITVDGTIVTPEDNGITLKVYNGKCTNVSVVNAIDKPSCSTIKIIKTYKASENDEGVLKADVYFNLYQGGTVIRQDKTDKNGELLFTDLAPGTYELEEIVPSDCRSSLNGKTTIVLKENTIETISVINTKISEEPKYSTIKIIKTYKTSENDEGVLKADVYFNLYQGGTVIRQDKTDINGELLFTGLAPGTYELEEIVPSNCRSSLNGKKTIDLKENTIETISVVNTKISEEPKYSTIKIIKTYKAYENDEGVLKADVYFKLYQGGTVIRQGKTDNNGELLFTGLVSGTYELEEIVPSNCRSSLNGKRTIDLKENTIETISVVNTKITNETDPPTNTNVTDETIPVNDTITTDEPLPVINRLPQTGRTVDFTGLLSVGFLCTLTGVYFIYRRR